MTATIQILEANPQCDDALTLLREAAVEASALYPEFHDPSARGPTNQPNPPRGIYLIAYLNDEPIGMAAHRPIDEETTEVRIMYVKQGARRLGLAHALLQRLEYHAKSVGFTCLVLETGNRQVAAMTLYGEYGFTRIEPFGRYKEDPTSVCFKKAIHV
jgi:putative acetyltransferase